MKYLSVILLAISLSANAQVYKWKDANGNVHFTDTPPPNQQTEVVDVKPAQQIGTVDIGDGGAQQSRQEDAGRSDNKKAENGLPKYRNEPAEPEKPEEQDEDEILRSCVNTRTGACAIPRTPRIPRDRVQHHNRGNVHIR